MVWPKESRRHGLASKGIPTASSPQVQIIISKQPQFKLPNGLARKKGITERDVDPEELRIGIEIEMEHTGDREIAKQIALDHLAEFPNYYTELVKLERKLGASGKNSFKKVLDDDEMLDFIIVNGLRDWQGELDFNSAKEIAGASNRWVLKEVSLDNFDWIVEPLERKEKSDIPPIILDLGDNEFEVLDGKHRIGERRWLKEKTILAYVGEA